MKVHLQQRSAGSPGVAFKTLTACHMNYNLTSRDARRLPRAASSKMETALLICSVLLLAIGCAGAQTTSSRFPTAQLTPARPEKGPAQTPLAPAKPTRTVAGGPAPAKADPAITNAPAAQPWKPLQFHPSLSFLNERLEIWLNQPKPNELTAGRHTYSGIVVQAIKAKRLLQLLNPGAPSDYGSGWDNIEVFPASVTVPRLSYSPSIFRPGVERSESSGRRASPGAWLALINPRDEAPYPVRVGTVLRESLPQPLLLPTSFGIEERSGGQRGYQCRPALPNQGPADRTQTTAVYRGCRIKPYRPL